MWLVDPIRGLCSSRFADVQDGFEMVSFDGGNVGGECRSEVYAPPYTLHPDVPPPGCLESRVIASCARVYKLLMFEL